MSLPQIPTYRWRPMRAADAQALARFEAECAQVDGITTVNDEADWARRLAAAENAERNSIVSVNNDDAIAATGWIWYQDEVDEIQGFPDGLVRPDLRGQGIGSALLRWLEDCALDVIATDAQQRPPFLRVLFYHSEPTAIALIEENGYFFQNSENELCYDLSLPLPNRPLPEGLTIEPYSLENKHDFYRGYRDSFVTRGTELAEEKRWTHHFADPDDDEFQQRLSFLVRDDERPIAYVVSHADTDEEIDFAQVGVSQDYRRRGIASALLAEALKAAKSAGFQRGVLTVNINNPGAQKAYEDVGFVLRGQYRVYGKRVV